MAPHFCIVGSGPAGFYTAQGLSKAFPAAFIDMFEKLPVPFGLVRYGVAPDHPDVKNAIDSFTKTAQKDCFSFNGNVTVGRDVSLEQLQKSYHAVILCTGANNDKRLCIPGEDLLNVLSARSFVGWYNGLPDNAKLAVNLDVETAVVLGHGNVALDVARILLTKLDALKKTDITEYALEALSHSRIKRVILIGRRGPLQVAFTIKELREMFNLENCTGIIKSLDLKDINSLAIEALQRPRRRLTELMLKHACANVGHAFTFDKKLWELRFLRSPVEFFPSRDKKFVGGICLKINSLQGVFDKAIAVPTEETEILECGLVLRSIGYVSQPIEAQLPFDETKGIVSNTEGRVSDKKGLYCSGWVATGPVGVILSTMNDGFRVSRLVADDVKSGALDLNHSKEGRKAVMHHLQSKSIQVVTFRDWLKIDEVEQARGLKIGKPREKIADIEEMLRIARSNKT